MEQLIIFKMIIIKNNHFNVKMSNFTQCDDNWGTLTEFFEFKECKVYIPLDKGLRISEIALSIFIFLMEAIILYKRRKFYKTKNSLAKVLIIFTLCINHLIMLRPIIGLATKYRSVNSIVVNLLNNIIASFIADIAILFVLFEVNILHKGTIKSNTWFYKQRITYLGGLMIIQTILYSLSAVIPRFTNINVSSGFWLTTAITDIGAIPYLCIAGIIIRNRLNRMEQNNYKALSRQILIITGACGILGGFTFIASLVLFILNGKYVEEWMFIHLCWLAATIFCGVIFIILIRKNKKPAIVSSSRTTKSDTLTTRNVDSTRNGDGARKTEKKHNNTSISGKDRYNDITITSNESSVTVPNKSLNNSSDKISDNLSQGASRTSDATSGESSVD